MRGTGIESGIQHGQKDLHCRRRLHDRRTSRREGQVWEEIALLVPGGRSGADIMNRFFSVHRARPSGESSAKYKEHRKWTADEDAIIQNGIAEHGNKFAKIARLLGEDRDGDAVKTRFRSPAFLKAATGSAMAAAASVPAILTNDESTDVVPRVAKRVKFTIPSSFVDGGVAGVLNGGTNPDVIDGETETMAELPPLPELAFSPVPHADIDSFDFTLSNMDFDENDDTVVEYQYLSEAV